MTSVAKTGKEKRVLIVSFRFPPQGGMGALRVGKFAKYLPEYGWNPTILTIGKVEGLPSTTSLEISESSVVRTRFMALDYMLPYQTASDESNHNKGISHSLGLRGSTHGLIQTPRLIYTLLRRQILPFEMIGWYPYAIKEGLRLMSKCHFNVIFSSSSPNVSHIIASYLNQKTGIPWVAEFRDLWALNHYTRKHQPFRFIEERYEKHVMRDSNSLITVSEPWAKSIDRLHSKPVEVIHNGFDKEDYAITVPLRPKFTISYTGNIYRGKQDTIPLLQAIKSLQEDGNIHASNFELRFFGGNVIREISPTVDRYKLHDLVKVHGFVPLEESVKRQKESAALLLLGWNDPSEKGVYPGKIFEYLGAHRPILALGLKDEMVNKLLEKSGMGVMLSKPSEIKSLINRWFNEFKTNGDLISYNKPNMPFIESFTRRKQTEKLAKLFDEISQGNPLNCC